MKDKQFWDAFLSSMEELTEDPPKSVKEGVFQGMDRYYRRRRRLKRGMVGMLGICALGLSSAFFISEAETNLEKLSEEQDEMPASSDLKGAIEVFPLAPSGESKASKNEAQRKREIASARGTKEQKRSAVSIAQAKKSKKMQSEHEEVQASRNNDKASLGQDPISKEGRAVGKKAASSNERTYNKQDARGLKNPDSDHDGFKIRNNKGAGDAGERSRKGLDPMPAYSLEERTVEPDQAKLDTIDPIEKKPGFSSQDQRFFIGSDLALNFTRLMDQRTIESFESTSLVSTDADLYFDHGISAGVRLGARTKVLGRYFMKKDIGQQYGHYENGRFRSEAVQLSYRNYEVLVEHDVAQGYIKAKHRTYLSIYGGGHYAHLRKAERKEEGSPRAVTVRYKDHSFGVDGGLRMGLEMRSGLDLGFLLGASYSLTPIRKADADEMLTERDVRNLSLGGGLSLRYHFGSDF